MAADKALLANRAIASDIHTYKNPVGDVDALPTRLVLKDFSFLVQNYKFIFGHFLHLSESTSL